MTRSEITQAHQLLADRVERIDTAIYGDGQCLTAYWIDGGQRLFYTIDEVREHVAEH